MRFFPRSASFDVTSWNTGWINIQTQHTLVYRDDNNNNTKQFEQHGLYGFDSY